MWQRSIGERRHFQSQYLYQITADFFLQLCCTLSALHTPELQVFKEKWSHISGSPQEKPDIKAGITQYKCITFFFFNCLHFFAHIFQKIASEWVFYIITAELCRIKLLILSLPMGQSALMNKSGILFNITLKRHKGINNNLYQIKCSKNVERKKKTACFKGFGTETNHHCASAQRHFSELRCVLQNEVTCSSEAACCLVPIVCPEWNAAQSINRRGRVHAETSFWS